MTKLKQKETVEPLKDILCRHFGGSVEAAQKAYPGIYHEATTAVEFINSDYEMLDIDNETFLFGPAPDQKPDAMTAHKMHVHSIYQRALMHAFDSYLQKNFHCPIQGRILAAKCLPRMNYLPAILAIEKHPHPHFFLVFCRYDEMKKHYVEDRKERFQGMLAAATSFCQMEGVPFLVNQILCQRVQMKPYLIRQLERAGMTSSCAASLLTAMEQTAEKTPKERMELYQAALRMQFMVQHGVLRHLPHVSEQRLDGFVAACAAKLEEDGMAAQQA